MRLTLLLTTTIASLAAAHAKITIIYGNLGGNGSAVGVLGSIVPKNGSYEAIQRDTTVFPLLLHLKVNGLGRVNAEDTEDCEAGVDLNPSDLENTFKLSGDTLPQVSADGSSTLIGIWHMVTGDGAGPISVVIDDTATGEFADGMEATVSMNVPGNQGSIRIREGGSGSYMFEERAPIVNPEYPFTIHVPQGIRCKGEVVGKTKVCFMKISNLNGKVPFGGTVAFQVQGG